MLFRCIQELLELRELIVSRNRLVQLPISSLAKLPELERIMAHSNQIATIGDIRKIRRLTVGINNIRACHSSIHFMSVRIMLLLSHTVTKLLAIA